MNADGIQSLQPVAAALLERFGPHFGRETTWEHWRRYLLEPIAGLKRKSIEPIAPPAGAPVTLLLFFLLLFSRLNSLRNALPSLLSILLALVGGVVGLRLTGQKLSGPA